MKRHQARVLIVEDEAVTALDMRATLEGMGVAVVGIVGSAEAALRAIAAERPHLVLLDLSLAGEFAGVELARTIGRSGIPVLFCSGHLGDGAVAALQDIEAAGWLAKPFYPVNLRETVAAALEALP